jgi:glutamate racemase
LACIREAAGERVVEIFSQACPLFVSLVEEGEVDSQITRLVAEKYLAGLRERQIDTLVLGCTHYPLLKPVLTEVMGASVALVDSAEAVAAEVEDLLRQNDWLNPQVQRGSAEFYVTDAAQRFHRIAAQFLSEPLAHLEAVEVWGHDRLQA